MKEQPPMADDNDTQILIFDPDQKTSCLPGVCGQSSYPITAMVHVCFKIFHFFCFLALPLTTQAVNFIAIIILIAAVDFWLTKNIAGRRLVGLRWWIQFTQQGQQVWRFQSRVDQRLISSANETVFWWAIYLSMIGWVILTVINVLKGKWAYVGLTIFNFMLLSKCYQTKANNMTKLMQQHGRDVIMRYMKGSIITDFKK